MAKRVLLLATGDTIAHVQHTGRPRVARGAELLADLDLSTVDVVAEDMLAEPSWDTSPSTMLTLARRVRSALEEGFHGVVVTHGVDTLVETAFLAELMAGPAVASGGIVFTGAARCWDAGGSRGPANLRDALTAAADPAVRGLGALVCSDGELHAARWAGLQEATAFCSAPYPTLGRIDEKGVVTTWVRPDRLPVIDGEPSSDVALIKTYPGMPAELLHAVVNLGAQGIVLEGTGADNVPGELFTAIFELTQWEVPAVIASRDAHGAGQAGTSGLAMKMGAISAGWLDGPRARVALMALGCAGTTNWFAAI